MLNQITKKEALNKLINNKSIFIGSYFTTLENIKNLVDKVKKENNYNDVLENSTIRKVTKVNSNSIVFNNSSYLYNHDFSKAYLDNNTLYLQNKNDSNIIVYEIIK